MAKKFSLNDKLVLLRVDINSPVSKGRVLDSPRFEEAARTIEKILNKRGKLVIIAHQGRKGDRDFTSLKQHARILSRHAGRKVEYIDDLFGEKALARINELKIGEALLLRNVRDYDEETKPEMKPNRFTEFSKLFDCFINDAFSDSHRRHSSIVIPPRHIPCSFGPEFDKEIKKLDRFALHHRFRNTLIIFGGSKVEDYLPLFRFLEDRTNRVIAGGVIGNLFLKIKGVNLGFEERWMRKQGIDKLARVFSKIYFKHMSQIILPVDFALAGGRRKEFPLTKAPFRKKIMDVGHDSVELFKAESNRAGRIIMKGPLGFSEYHQFSYGTNEILKHLAKLSNRIPILLSGGHLTTTAGGVGLKRVLTSLAGGATIDYLSGLKLDGIEAIRESRHRIEIDL